MKEFLKTDTQTLKDLDWPELTLYEIVNNTDLDDSIFSLIFLKFSHCAMNTVYHFIFRNHELELQSKNIGACGIYRCRFKHTRKYKRKTLKYYCKTRRK